MSFPTQYRTHERKISNSGSPIKDVFTPHYDAFGELIIEKTGEEDLYSYIQSHRESCDIHLMLERYANGDDQALSRAQGFYADTTGMPQTYAEVLNAVLAGEAAFNQLPKEIKQEFDNSFSQWLASMDRPDFAKRMGFAESPVPTDVPDSVLKQPEAAQPAPSTPSQPTPQPVTLNTPTS